MITPDYARLMAAYNAEMNRRLYAAAQTLDDAERRAGGGAFWSSIHGTLNHILWADQLWLARFTGTPDAGVGMAGSDRMFETFEALAEARRALDQRIVDWAAGLRADGLAGEIVWISKVLNREMRSSRALLISHLFNHQTHHRGQAHALLTRAGASIGDTDLFLIVPEIP